MGLFGLGAKKPARTRGGSRAGIPNRPLAERLAEQKQRAELREKRQWQLEDPEGYAAAMKAAREAERLEKELKAKALQERLYGNDSKQITQETIAKVIKYLKETLDMVVVPRAELERKDLHETPLGVISQALAALGPGGQAKDVLSSVQSMRQGPPPGAPPAPPVFLDAAMFKQLIDQGVPPHEAQQRAQLRADAVLAPTPALPTPPVAPAPQPTPAPVEQPPAPEPPRQPAPVGAVVVDHFEHLTDAQAAEWLWGQRTTQPLIGQAVRELQKVPEPFLWKAYDHLTTLEGWQVLGAWCKEHPDRAGTIIREMKRLASMTAVES